MDLKSILNVLLLSISLATLLLTAISYLLYKLRQLNVAGELKDPVRMESAFFIRFAPHLEEINRRAREDNKMKKARKSFGFSLGALFTIVVSVIAAGLFAEAYLSELQLRRNKINIVENYRELVDKGLLQRYSYEPNPSEEKNLPLQSPAQVSDRENILETLRSQTIIVGNTIRQNEESNSALKSWQYFLQKNEIKFKIFEFTKIPDDALLIIPWAESLNRTEKENIENHLARGGSVFFSGPVGIYDGTGERTDSEWSKKIIGVSFRECQVGANMPTIFAVNQAPWWDFEPGRIELADLPKKGPCGFLADNKTSGAAFASDYNGQVLLSEKNGNRPLVRAVFRNQGGGRIAWLQSPPDVLRSAELIQFEKQSSIFLPALHWAVGAPVVQAARWPDGVDLGVIFSASVDGQSDNFDFLVSAVEKLKLPLSLFIPDEKLQFVRDRLVGKDLSNFEFATLLNAPINSHLQKNRAVEKSDFIFVEKNRLDVEEQTAKMTSGGFIPLSNDTRSLRLAAMSNRLRYIYVEDYEEGPVAFNNDESIFYKAPHYSPFSSEGVGRRPAAEMPEHLELDARLGRMLTVHVDDESKSVGSEIAEVVKKLNDFRWHAFNFAEWVTWSQSRSLISIKVRKLSDQDSNASIYEIKIVNTADVPVKQFALNLDFSKVNSTVNLVNPNLNLQLKNNRQLRIEKLAPHDALAVQLRVQRGGGK